MKSIIFNTDFDNMSATEIEKTLAYCTRRIKDVEEDMKNETNPAKVRDLEAELEAYTEDEKNAKKALESHKNKDKINLAILRLLCK